MSALKEPILEAGTVTSMSLNQPIQKRAESLTIVRFFAAFMVFCDHYAYQMLERAPAGIRNLFDRGSAGVSLFFILSGFLMVVVYGARFEADGISTKKFWINRFARIYPAYLFALILGLQGSYNWIKSVGIPATLNVPVYVLSKLTMTDGWYFGTVDPRNAFSWMQQGWSLSTELVFYALFPFLLPWLIRLRPAQAVALAISALLSGPIIMSTIGKFQSMHGGIVERLSLGESGYSPLPNLPPFFVGMAAGVVILHYGARIKNRRQIQILAVGVCLLYQSITPEVHLPNLLFVGLQCCYAFLIFALGLEFFQTDLVPASRFKKFWIVLGEASYSMYLLQSAVSTWLTFIFVKLGLRTQEAVQDPMFFGVCLVSTCVLAYLTWRFIETPARRAIQKKLLKSSAE